MTLGLPPKLLEKMETYRDRLRSIFIVSSVVLLPGDQVQEGFESEEIEGLVVKVEPSQDEKCERCWVHDPTTGDEGQPPTICRRCFDALKEMGYVST